MLYFVRKHITGNKHIGNKNLVYIVGNAVIKHQRPYRYALVL